MDDEWLGYLVPVAFLVSTALLFLGSLGASRGNSFWATRLMTAGSAMMMGGMALVVILFLAEEFTAFSVDGGISLVVIFGLLFLLGPLLFFIALFGFCARWGATGRRRAELREITTALRAAQAAAQSSTQVSPSPQRNPNTPPAP